MKTSIVYVTIKAVVQHEDDTDPAELVGEADYNLSLSPEDGKIIDTEMVDAEDKGECHPTEHYLLDDDEE